MFPLQVLVVMVVLVAVVLVEEVAEVVVEEELVVVVEEVLLVEVDKEVVEVVEVVEAILLLLLRIHQHPFLLNQLQPQPQPQLSLAPAVPQPVDPAPLKEATPMGLPRHLRSTNLKDHHHHPLVLVDQEQGWQFSAKKTLTISATKTTRRRSLRNN